MQRRPLAKNERRPVIDSGNVVARGGSGSVIMRGSSGTAIRRGGRSGLRFIVFLAIVGGLYWAAGTYRHEIIERFPAAFPVLKAIGFDVSEPAGYGLRAEVLRTDRQSEGMNQAYLLINGMIENQRSTRTTIPRLRLVITSSRHADMVVLAEPPQQSLGPGERTRFEVRHRTGAMLFDVRVRVGFEKN